MTPENDSPEAQPQGGALLPCRVCGSVPVKGRWFREEGVAHCSKTSCFMFQRPMTATEWNTLMAATGETTVEAALADLFALLQRNKRGQWNFLSLSKDASKFDAIMDRLRAATRTEGAKGKSND